MHDLEILESRRLLAATYYVSPFGDDTADGRSPAAAWRTIERVNGKRWNPGDKILFQGGQRFTVAGSAGANVLTNAGFESGLAGWSEAMGTSAANATVTSSARFGSGAIQLSGSGDAIRAQDVTAKLKGNQAYKMSAWERSSNVGGGDRRVGVTFYLAGEKVATYYRGFRNTEWQQTEWAFVAPPVFDKALVWVARTGDSSTFYVDDLKLHSIPNGLVFDDADSGTVYHPVTLGSYGVGKATIDARDGIGLWGTNVAGMSVQNLVFTGSWNATTGTGGNAGVGIEFVNTRNDNSKLTWITIEKCQASGFRWAGARIGGWSGKSGFHTVLVTDSVFRDNGDAGLMIRGEFDRNSRLYANEKVYVARCRAYGNGGIPDKGGNSGSGIQMTDTFMGTVERSVAYHNGALNNYAGGGPVGIWAFDASKITLQYNESYANRSASGKDGAGFDLDGGVTRSVMQNNYSHDNDGAGFLLCQFNGARAWGSNFVRYNVSQNDGRKSDYGAITITGGGGLNDAIVEHNTVYVSPSDAGGTPSGVRVKYAGTNVHVRNNAIVTRGGASAVHADAAGTSALFNGNAYWCSGDGTKFRWGGGSYSTLSGWRSATGRETVGTAPTGCYEDLKLTAPGAAPTLNDPYKLATLTQYRPSTGSPLLGRAAALAAPFAIYTPADYDFFGRALASVNQRSIGAAQG